MAENNSTGPRQEKNNQKHPAGAPEQNKSVQRQQYSFFNSTKSLKKPLTELKTKSPGSPAEDGKVSAAPSSHGRGGAASASTGGGDGD